MKHKKVKKRPSAKKKLRFHEQEHVSKVKKLKPVKRVIEYCHSSGTGGKNWQNCKET